MKKGVFIDKDGTLVENSGYPEIIPSDELLEKDVVEGLKYLQEKDHEIFNGVHISGVDGDLPFEAISWGEVKVVDEKPPIERRYLGLKKNLFRDLSYVGIDG